MKLKIGENIRRLRREAALTQDAFAERVGVSGQAVSRWETGAAYPDIELLPVIADLFGVGVEELMGVASPHRSDAVHAELRRIRAIPTASEALSEIRKLHRASPHNIDVMEYLCRCTDRMDELQTAIDQLLALGLTRTECHSHILHLLLDEEESRLPAHLDRYTTPLSESAELFLEERYEYRRDYEAFEVRRQQNFLAFFCFLTRRLAWDTKPACPVENCLWAARHTLGLIDLLTDTSNPRSASGDGIPDLWFAERVTAGLRCSCQAAATGHTEDALATLEDVTDLCETCWHLPVGTALTFRCPALNRFRGIVQTETDKACRSRVVVMNHDPSPFAVNHHPKSVLFCLTTPHGWEWFDSIRHHTRYLACVERIRAWNAPTSASIG